MYQRKRQVMRALVLQMKKREKKGVKLELINIMHRRATVTVYICMVTVTFVHLYIILQPLMSVFFFIKICKWAAFCILQDCPWTDAVTLNDTNKPL